VSAGRAGVLALAASLVAGCSAIPLAPGAGDVRLTNQEPQGCERLGEVLGKQGNSLTGSSMKNEDLVVGAMNDLKNKAHALGANVVQVISVSAGIDRNNKGGRAMTSSLQQGAAFRCPPESMPGYLPSP
jgi:hypothetical protein